MKKALLLSSIYLLALTVVQAQYWSTTGNSGTSTSSNFIGTTDANGLVFKVNSQFSGLIDLNQNTCFGYQSLISNTGGSSTALGYQALNYNTSGNYNTAVGWRACPINTTGVYNTAMGGNSLKNETGSFNTGVGYNALSADYSGSYNTAIGYNANVNIAGTTYTNSTAVGYAAVATASNQIRIGNSSVSSIGGYVGWSNISDRRFKKDVEANVPGLAFIKLLTPVTYHLDVSGIERRLNQHGETPQEISPIIAASIKAKEQILYSGFMAQDVQVAAAKIGYDFNGIDAPKNEDDLYGLRYADFVVPVVKSIQELSAVNDSLQEQISSLQSQLNEVIKQLNVLKAGKSLTEAGKSSAWLYQNAPNPFNSATAIRYYLPTTATIAQVVIINAAGQLIRTVPVANKGEGITTFAAGELAAGNYFYSLVVDGKTVDTKKMVLTR